MLNTLKTKRELKAMRRTLDDNANLTAAITAVCELSLHAPQHRELNSLGIMPLKQAYDLCMHLTHHKSCETVAPYNERKPVSRLAIVKTLRLCFELGYKLGRESKS